MFLQSIIFCLPLLTGQNAHQNLTGSRKGLKLQIKLFLRNVLENENDLNMTTPKKPDSIKA